ncbi:Eco57I restriction-modification methylase domain-containing protein [Halogeometricum luteum]|uniref:site-specific DNA-methyltransferase (adenine-specific) n=1 Tax=Halogeometricum luteum TaxID=2950537 RepID=A0ABU2G9R4_9EURY|nr:TaqI-like C-terminal specificity domain-containing protein [Halogeometricum sp. S3BR5-2]MDS0297034.1 Eco57I restriction-modification methylase domain-containing protein [Halogeometricum sp. S3BR5-2]
MQTALTYRTNRDLFSNYYLDEHLPETEAWDELSDDELREAKADIMDLWEREKGTAPKRNESQLEEKFIRPMFRKLGIPFEVEESTSRTQRRPDYGFFESEDAARGAFERREEGGDFYKDAVAVADAKRWGRPLDTRGSGEHERDFENPSYQIHVYLQETPARWAVLTDGKKWRLYYGPTSHRLDSYYEIDLPTVLEKGDLEDFKYFYLFFRHGAFLEDSSGECFLDEVYDESNVFAQELGEDLQDNIYEAIKILSEGFMQYPDNDLSEEDLGLIHDSSLIYLYRLIFVLYAESEGRDLLDTNNEIYEESYSLNSLKQDIAEELDSQNPKYRDWQDNLWDRLDELFKLIDQGSKSRGIPEEDLYIPAYNGGLFRTNPDEDDSVEARFLANHQVGDAYLAEVIELLTRSQNGNGGGKIFVDYSSLDVRHLGSIYEGLLEYQLDVADEPLALEDGEYVPAGEGDEVIVEEGEVHLSTGSGERKATGSYYTPEYVVEYIVDETLGPLVDDIRGSLVGQSAFDEGGFAEEFAEGVFDLKILDPAMGSGHFLTSAIDYLAREIIDAQERQAAQQGIETVDEEHDINWARRQVAQRCIYGVDLNPLAVELAKVSLWLRTLAAEQPLAFLDHHLKTGNSLVGSDIEEIEELESDAGGDGENASLADFGVARKGTIEQLMRIYQDFIAIENQDLADVKEMEAKYDEFERNKLRQRLEAMANVSTADDFGLDGIPSGAYERMAAALDEDEEWKAIEELEWFRTAQKWASRDRYFHWRLEYPEVFYGSDGVEKDKPGFDAVIGNPPYIRSRSLDEFQKSYFKSKYDSTTGRWDIYCLFTEKGIEICTGSISYIQPSMFLRRPYGEGLRKVISERSHVTEIVELSDVQVFGEATNYVCILSLSNNTSEDEFVVYTPDPNDYETLDRERMKNYNLNNSDLSKKPWDVIPAPVANVLGSFSDDLVTLDKVTKSISQGIDTSKDEVYFVDPETVSEYQLEEEILKPVLKGQDVKRYEPPKTDLKSIYPYKNDRVIPEDQMKSEFPNTWDYLKENEDKVRSRTHVMNSNRNWYELWCERDSEIYQNPKILTPEISDQSNFTADTGDKNYYFNTKVKSIRVTEDYNLKFLLGLLNSELLEFIYRGISPQKRGGFRAYKTGFLHELQVPTSVDQEIVRAVDDILDNKNQMSEINIDLSDYLGGYSWGDSLQEIPGYQPPAGVSDTILSKTSEEHDGLRVGDVHVETTDTKTTIYASARYKPEDPEEYDTDQWGYTETQKFAALEFIGLSQERENLLKQFIPFAVEKGNGFAGFREKATKTNSLINRLEKISLPQYSDIENSFNNYQRNKSRYDNLKNEVEQLEQDIDKRVYELYSIPKEKIKTVKEGI